MPGLYIKRDEFPTSCSRRRAARCLWRRNQPDLRQAMRSEIFSQGTLMLRLVIQTHVSRAVRDGGVFAYRTGRCGGHPVVILFNMLVGPVFSAGSVTSERERQTLDLLLVTPVTPWQMLGQVVFGAAGVERTDGVFAVARVVACMMPLPFCITCRRWAAMC